MNTGIKQMALDAIAQYKADTAAGGEPAYPAWADQVLALLNTVACQHRAIDGLLAWIIDRHADFHPTKSQFWPLILEANAVQVCAQAGGNVFERGTT